MKQTLSTAGNLQFQWAQNTATAVDTKVLANSYLEARPPEAFGRAHK